MQEADHWYSDFEKLMEYSRNVEYYCRRYFSLSLQILNRFACPFDKKTVVAGENNTTGEEE
jgi:hypothetical protein